MSTIKYQTNKLVKFFITTELPVALLPNGKPLFLNGDLVKVIRTCHESASASEIRKQLGARFSATQTKKILGQLVKDGILIVNNKFPRWQGNTFGASLIDNEELDAVKEVLDAKRLFRYQDLSLDHLSTSIQSPCLEFERAIASTIGCKHSLVLNSGTSALECALRALGIGPGDNVIVPAFTYIGTIASILNVGAIPTICEIDDSLMLSPEAVEKCINQHTRAILCVHIRGAAAHIVALSKIADRERVHLIEDCAQAFGTMYLKKPVGSFGVVGCFSFHQHKVITTGEGGAITTDRTDLYKRMLIISDASRLFSQRDMLPGEPGHNYRMSEVHAAIGLAQLRKLPLIADHLRKLYGFLTQELSASIDFEIQNMPDPDGAIPQALYLIFKSSVKAQSIARSLTNNGIYASVLLRPGSVNHDIYTYWPYALEKIGVVHEWHPEDPTIGNICPSSLDILSRTLCLPLGCNISQKEAKSAVKLILGLRTPSC